MAVALLFTVAPQAPVFGDSQAAITNQPAPSRRPGSVDYRQRIAGAYAAARNEFETQTNSDQAAWRFGRACFDIATLTNNNSARATIAQQGIAACRQALQLKPNSAQAHYYLGMNLGRFADTKRNLAALRMVRDMEREFLAARDLDDHLDHAGPNRNLGLLYEQAPSIISVGNRSRARQHLLRAVELAPDYPENRLNLIEAYLKWGDRSGELRELNLLQRIWTEAHQKFSGEEWTSSWADWEARFDAAKRKIEEPVKHLESPRESD